MRKSLANNLKYLLKALSKCAYMHKQNRKHCQTKEEDEGKNEDSFPFLKGSFPSNFVLRYFPNVVINLNLPSKSASLVAHILFFFIGWIWTSCLVEEQISELYGMKGTAWVAKDNTTDLPNRKQSIQSAGLSSLAGSVFDDSKFESLPSLATYHIRLHFAHSLGLMPQNDNVHFNWTHKSQRSTKFKGSRIKANGTYYIWSNIFLNASHVKRWSIPLSLSLCYFGQWSWVSLQSKRSYFHSYPVNDCAYTIQTICGSWSHSTNSGIKQNSHDAMTICGFFSSFYFSSSTKKVFFISLTQDVYQNICFFRVLFRIMGCSWWELSKKIIIIQ